MTVCGSEVNSSRVQQILYIDLKKGGKNYEFKNKLKATDLCYGLGSLRKALEGEREAVCGTAAAWQGCPEGHLGMRQISLWTAPKTT